MFQSKEFNDYAKKNLVLVEVDFPSKKPQSDALKKANNQLKEQYGIRGFPTLVVLDSAGEKLGQIVGYGGGGPKSVIGKIEGLKK